jgi:acetylornithine deacetylase
MGEPTSLHPVLGGKGYALATITVYGKEAHSAFPSEGRSAIYDAARVVTGIERIAQELEREGGDPSFDPPFTTLNVGLVQGGTAKNIVAGECRLTIEWRQVPDQDPWRVPEMIGEMLESLAISDPGFRGDFVVLRSDPAFTPSASRTVAEILSKATGNLPSTISFGSEAAHLQVLSEETLVFGPGTMTVAHKTGEFVPVAELHRCVEHLESAIRQICGGGTVQRSSTNSYSSSEGTVNLE